MFAKEESLIPFKSFGLGVCTFASLCLARIHPSAAILVAIATGIVDLDIRQQSSDETSLPNILFSTGQTLFSPVSTYLTDCIDNFEESCLHP